MPNFFDLLQVYLALFAIVVVVGLLLFFLSGRRSDGEPIGDMPLASEAPATSEGTGISPGEVVNWPLGGSGTAGFEGPDTMVDAYQPRKKARILVVDDSAVPRAKLKKLFESQGYEVETAVDGVKAMEAIGKSRFSVILTDLEMPSMDGFELIAAVQGSIATEDIPVIAITGHEDLQARVHAIQGLYGIFKKPWNDNELLKRVEVLASLRPS